MNASIQRPSFLWLQVLLLACLLLSATAEDATTTSPGDDFFLLCSGGKDQKLEKLLQEHPTWVHAKTADEEHCLHLAGIRGYPKVTQLFLNKGADPNIRSNAQQGLRMHPLSWNVYSNHYDNCRILLDAGANVNLDFDFTKYDPETKTREKQVVTVLDIIDMIGAGTSEFDKLRALLLKHGAKHYKDLVAKGE